MRNLLWHVSGVSCPPVGKDDPNGHTKGENKQRVIQTKGLSVYFIILTAGLMLYEIEFAVRDLTFGLIFYSLTLGWMAFVWFILRKRTIAKQENGAVTKI